MRNNGSGNRKFQLTPQLLYVIRPIGAFILTSPAMNNVWARIRGSKIVEETCQLQSLPPSLRLELVLILSIRVSSSKRDLKMHNPNNITSLPHNDHVT